MAQHDGKSWALLIGCGVARTNSRPSQGQRQAAALESRSGERRFAEKAQPCLEKLLSPTPLNLCALERGWLVTRVGRAAGREAGVLASIPNPPVVSVWDFERVACIFSCVCLPLLGTEELRNIAAVVRGRAEFSSLCLKQLCRGTSWDVFPAVQRLSQFLSCLECRPSGAD